MAKCWDETVGAAPGEVTPVAVPPACCMGGMDPVLLRPVLSSRRAPEAAGGWGAASANPSSRGDLGVTAATENTPIALPGQWAHLPENSTPPETHSVLSKPHSYLCLLHCCLE